MTVLADGRYNGEECGRVSKEAYMSKLRRRYLKFLEDMSYTNTRECANLDLVDEVYAALCDRRKSSCLPVSVLRACCAYATMVCKHNTFEDKVKIAHCTALATELDNMMSAVRMRTLKDGGKRLKEDCQLIHLKFSNPSAYEKLYPTRGPLHAVLEELILYAHTDLHPYFPTQPRHHGSLFTSLLQFCEASLLECELAENSFEVQPEMSRFPSFLRLRSGVSQVFILFVLASPHLVPNKYSSEDGGSDTLFFYNNIYPLLPELVAFSDHMNDVLSFYKECEDEADGLNYIASLAKVNQTSPYEAFDDLINQMVTIRKKVMAMAERSGSLEERFSGGEEDSCTVFSGIYFLAHFL
ncbi:hypothetical protein Mapa_005815 [Marchantia paleacea]|nr:hypothetical protein Mapa_005815 [Marchantia paleacea]